MSHNSWGHQFNVSHTPISLFSGHHPSYTNPFNILIKIWYLCIKTCSKICYQINAVQGRRLKWDLKLNRLTVVITRGPKIRKLLLKKMAYWRTRLSMGSVVVDIYLIPSSIEFSNTSTPRPRGSEESWSVVSLTVGSNSESVATSSTTYGFIQRKNLSCVLTRVAVRVFLNRLIYKNTWTYTRPVRQSMKRDNLINWLTISQPYPVRIRKDHEIIRFQILLKTLQMIFQILHIKSIYFKPTMYSQ